MSTNPQEMLAAALAVVPRITPDAAADLVRTAGAVIVDVREPAEVAASGKAKGALAIPRGLLESQAGSALSKDRPVILYCGMGARAALAGKMLLDLGYTDVRNAGGLKDLLAGGWTVEPG